MSPVTILAAVAALLPNQVAYVTTDPVAVTATVRLPTPGAALFAAPDGAVLVPLADRDATAVIGPGRSVETWKGRTFPLFFDEIDRMYVVVPGGLMVLSYPERLVLGRSAVQGLDGAYRAACSDDGRVVAAVRPTARRELLVLAPRGDLRTWPTVLTGEADDVVVGPDGGWVLAGLADGALELVPVGAAAPHFVLPVGGAAVVGLTVTAEGREAAAVVAGRNGEPDRLVTVRVKPGARQPLKVRTDVPLPAPSRAVVAAGDRLVVATSSGVLVYSRRGKKLEGALDLGPTADLTALPERPRSVVPDWGEAQP